MDDYGDEITRLRSRAMRGVRQCKKRCTKVRALRSCSGCVHVARVVVSLVVHAVVGLTLGLIAHVVVVVFVGEFP